LHQELQHSQSRDNDEAENHKAQKERPQQFTKDISVQDLHVVQMKEEGKQRGSCRIIARPATLGCAKVFSSLQASGRASLVIESLRSDNLYYVTFDESTREKPNPKATLPCPSPYANPILALHRSFPSKCKGATGPHSPPMCEAILELNLRWGLSTFHFLTKQKTETIKFRCFGTRSQRVLTILPLNIEPSFYPT